MAAVVLSLPAIFLTLSEEFFLVSGIETPSLESNSLGINQMSLTSITRTGKYEGLGTIILGLVLNLYPLFVWLWLKCGKVCGEGFH